MPPDLILTIRALDETGRAFEQVKQNLREIQELSERATGSPAAQREIARRNREEHQQELQRSRERIANVRLEQAADTNRSREKVADINQERNLETQRAREAIANTTRIRQAESNASREKIANLRDETSRIRLAGQEESRQIQRLRLQEQRRAREQRERFAQLRASQSRIGGGFTSWQNTLSTVGAIISTEILFALERVGRRMLEVTANFERLRLGITAFEGSPQVADAQISRVRQLAELPGIGFESGLRSVNRLRGAGVNFLQAERLLREISNLASIAGGTQQDVGESLRQIQQIVSTGRFQTENLRPIFERIPQLRGIFAAEFGGSTGEQIQQAIERQGITISQALDRVLARAELSPRAPETTLTNTLERLNDAFDDLLRVVGRQLTPTLRGFLEGTIETLEIITEFVDDYGETVGRGISNAIPLSVVGAGLGAGLPFLTRGLRSLQYSDLLFRSAGRVPERFGARSSARFAARQISVPNLDRVQFRDLINDTLESNPSFRERSFRERIQRFRDLGYQEQNAYELARRTGGGRFGRFVRSPAIRGSIGYAIAGAGVGALADFTYGPGRPGGIEETEGPTQLRRRVIENAEALRGTLIIVEQQIPNVNNAMREMESVFEEFVRTGNINRRVFEDTFENFSTILDQFRASSGTAISQFRAQLEQNYEDIQDIFRDDETGLFRAYDELSGRQRVRARALRNESELLQRAINRLVEYNDARNRELGTIPPVAGLPAGAGGAVNVVPQRIRAGTGIGDPTIGPAIGAPTSFDQRRGFQGTPRSLAELSSGAGEGVARQGYAVLEAARVFAREALQAFQEITRTQIPGPPRDFLRPTTGTQLLRSGILDPSRLTDLRSETSGLVREWRDLQETVSSFIRDTPIEQAFSPATVRTAMETREELTRMRDSLESVRDEFIELGGVPMDLAAGLTGAIEQIDGSIRNFQDTIRSAREAADDLRDVNRQIREQEIESRVLLRDEQFFGEAGRPPSLRDIQNLPFFRQPRERRRAAEQSRAQAFSNYFAGAATDIYNEFLAPSLLDAVGIGSGQSRAQERQLQNLTRSIEEERNRIRQDELLNAAQQAEELLEINREYEREKREIERQYEEERSDAWANWVRQQLTDFPRLIFEQLNLQLAARATNAIFNSLGIGGNIPITGSGLGSIGSTAGTGFSLGSALGAAGVAFSGYQAGRGLYEVSRGGGYNDIGTDLSNIGTDIGSFFSQLFGSNNSSGNVVVMSADTPLIQFGDNEVRTLGDELNRLRSEGRITGPQV